MPETQEKLIDAAESVFAAHGFHGASVREITHAAGSNVSSVNYHFGSKEALFIAMIRRRAAPINKRRIELLEDTLRTNGAAPLSMRQIVACIVQPMIDGFMGEDRTQQANFLRALNRVMSEEIAFMASLREEVFAEVIARFGSELARSLSDLPREMIATCFTYIGTSLSIVMQSLSKQCECADAPADSPDSRYLLSYIAGGLEAIVSDYRSQTK